MTEVELAVSRCPRSANQKFDAALAALQPPPIDPPLTVAEAWGRISRQFNDSLAQLAREFQKGYSHG